MDITMKLPEWIGVLAVICGGAFFIARLIYIKKVEKLEEREKDLVEDLDNKVSEITRLKGENTKLENERHIWKTEAQREKERFDLGEQEQQGTVKMLKEEHAKNDAILQAEIMKLKGLMAEKEASYMEEVKRLKGYDEKGIVRIFESKGKYQVIVKSLIEGHITAKIALISNNLQPRDHHECSFDISPGSEPYRVLHSRS